MTDTIKEWPSVPSSSGATAQGSGLTGDRAEGAKKLWVRTGYHRRRTNAKPLIIAAWNIRTLLDRKGSNRPERRSALVTRELQRYNVDIAALSETRFLDVGQLSEVGSGYTLYWSGRKTGRKAGVGFAVKTSLISQLESQPRGINERIMTMRLPLSDNKYATLVSVYAPTMTNPVEAKDIFYQQLDDIIRSVPSGDKLIIMGDLNARVGADHTAWTDIIGTHGIGKENSNGTLLLSLCARHSLSITNTFFQLKDAYKTTWMHPRSKHWHQIDHIICRQSDLKDFRITRAMRGAECSTDHILLRSKVNLKMQRKRRPQGKKPAKKLNVEKTCMPDIQEALQNELSKRLESVTFNKGETENNWSKLKEEVNAAATETLGILKRHHQDWFDDNDLEIRNLLTKKYGAHKAWLAERDSESKRKEFTATRRELQKRLRHLKDDWWKRKADEIQLYADSNNAKLFYSSLREVYGPPQRSAAPVRNSQGDILTDNEAINKRWAEHFEQLLNRSSSVEPTAIEEIVTRPPCEELDDLPTEEEVEKAISELQCGKSAGPDGIPPEVFKTGGTSLIQKFTEFLCLCWEDGSLPRDLKDARIVHLYKGKGDKSSCDNYRGISLLSIAGKIMAKVILNRLNSYLLDDILPESQCGFRKNRGTVDMIFAARQIQEKCKEQNMDLYVLFVDLTKAFDTVSRTGLWEILPRIGIPPKMVNIIRSFHDGMKARLVNGCENDEFPVTNGVKQGCVLAPTLFSFIFSMMLLSAFKESDPGIQITYRTDKGIFNTQRLKAKTKVTSALVRDLLYADDCAIVAHSEEDLQQLTTSLSEATKRFGLTISIKKTEVLFQPAKTSSSSLPNIQIDGKVLNNVDSFTYLGSTLSSTTSLDKEISSRISKANASFGRLHKRVWKERGLRVDTKCAVYRAVVLTALLYGCESWTLYSRHVKLLEQFHQRCLRQILNIKWFNRVSNVNVLEKAMLPSIEATLIQSQLRWSGHLTRMQDSRLPKQLFYCDLAEGHRGRGRPKLRYKDTLKQSLQKCNIGTDVWEEKTVDRSEWRQTVYSGTKLYESERRKKQLDIRAAAKHRAQTVKRTILCPVCSHLCASDFGLRSHMRVHK